MVSRPRDDSNMCGREHPFILKHISGQNVEYDPDIDSNQGVYLYKRVRITRDYNT